MGSTRGGSNTSARQVRNWGGAQTTFAGFGLARLGYGRTSGAGPARNHNIWLCRIKKRQLHRFSSNSELREADSGCRALGAPLFALRAPLQPNPHSTLHSWPHACTHPSDDHLLSADPAVGASSVASTNPKSPPAPLLALPYADAMACPTKCPAPTISMFSRTMASRLPAVTPRM